MIKGAVLGRNFESSELEIINYWNEMEMVNKKTGRSLVAVKKSYENTYKIYDDIIQTYSESAIRTQIELNEEEGFHFIHLDLLRTTEELERELARRKEPGKKKPIVCENKKEARDIMLKMLGLPKWATILKHARDEERERSR